MELLGVIKIISETEVISEKFQKREVVIETIEQYPQAIMVEFIQDKVDLLKNYKVGETVRIGINLRGRAWTDKQGKERYFNTVQGWKIAHDSSNQSESIPVRSEIESEEDLPF